MRERARRPKLDRHAGMLPNQPTWNLHGTADRTVSLAATQGLAASLPGAQLRVFEGHGHFSLLAGKAEEVLRVMRLRVMTPVATPVGARLSS
jgi:pimeloyl-ACP methyl ester carboxylesterase